MLAASASYIAVPAVIRHAIPEANPSLYFGMSLGLTFPFNILVGIPLYASIAQRLFGQGGRTPPLAGDARFNEITLPFAESLRGIPVLGPLYADVISGHALLVYVAILCVPLSWWVLYRTRFGLRLRAVGENPAAVDTAGVSVKGLRFAAVAITGLLCGLAGAYMATALQAGFGREMTAGRGYIALAALIFAK